MAILDKNLRMRKGVFMFTNNVLIITMDSQTNPMPLFVYFQIFKGHEGTHEIPTSEMKRNQLNSTNRLSNRYKQ